MEFKIQAIKFPGEIENILEFRFLILDIYKKYQLLLLKTEYISVLQSGSDDALKNASLYQAEILRTSQELQLLNSSFSNR